MHRKILLEFYWVSATEVKETHYAFVSLLSKANAWDNGVNNYF